MSDEYHIVNTKSETQARRYLQRYTSGKLYTLDCHSVTVHMTFLKHQRVQNFYLYGDNVLFKPNHSY